MINLNMHPRFSDSARVRRLTEEEGGAVQEDLSSAIEHGDHESVTAPCETPATAQRLSFLLSSQSCIQFLYIMTEKKASPFLAQYRQYSPNTYLFLLRTTGGSC